MRPTPCQNWRLFIALQRSECVVDEAQNVDHDRDCEQQCPDHNFPFSDFDNRRNWNSRSRHRGRLPRDLLIQRNDFRLGSLGSMGRNQ